jgi:hypothetical protein
MDAKGGVREGARGWHSGSAAPVADGLVEVVKTLLAAVTQQWASQDLKDLATEERLDMATQGEGELWYV